MPRHTTPAQALRYSYFTYTPAGIDTLSPQEIRTEYSRLRAIAQKRIKRLQAAGFKTPNVSLPAVKGLTPGQLANALMDVTRFIRARGSTVSGRREEIAAREKTLRQHYPEIDWDDINMDDFYEYMEAYNERYSNVIYPSDEAVTLYAVAKGKGMTTASLKKDMAYWHANQEKLEDYEPPNTRQASSATIRKRIEGLT